MKFLKSFLINLVALVFIIAVIFFIYPDIVRGMFEVYGSLFGPAAVLILVVAALPRRRR